MLSLIQSRKASVPQLEPGVLTLSLGLFAGFAPFALASLSMPWEADVSGL